MTLHDTTPESTLEARVGQRLRSAGLTIATAESSTGGLVATRLTDVPGSSAYMIGGVVAYANRAKRRLLSVDEQTLAENGAVSEPVAREMAVGVRLLFGVDLGVAVTGIAGPDGATATKPVGLTYVALSSARGMWVRRFIWTGDRQQNRAQSADASFQMVLDYLAGAL
ncbi:MAG: CinA family protein [Chloroflexi bacterium]|nr:CinA family protein [Chloroflexota bacterium]